jgi:hypothetical protein
MYNDGEEIPEALEGNMSIPNSAQPQVEGKLEFNTLDEPIKTTVVNSLKNLQGSSNHIYVLDEGPSCCRRQVPECTLSTGEEKSAQRV